MSQKIFIACCRLKMFQMACRKKGNAILKYVQQIKKVYLSQTFLYLTPTSIYDTLEKRKSSHSHTLLVFTCFPFFEKLEVKNFKRKS